jgi:WD40 repeat protein
MRRVAWLLIFTVMAGCQNVRRPVAEDEERPEENPPIYREVISAAISPDGRQILTTESAERWGGVRHTGFVTLWDAGIEQPAEAPAWPNPEPQKGIWSVSVEEQGEDDLGKTRVNGAAFDPTGLFVYVIGPTGRVVTLERTTGKRVRSFWPGSLLKGKGGSRKDEPGVPAYLDMNAGLFLPGAKYFVSVNDNRLNVWELATGKRVRSIDLTRLTDKGWHGGHPLAAHPDGARVILKYEWCAVGNDVLEEGFTEVDWRTGKVTGTVRWPNRVTTNVGYLPGSGSLWCWSVNTRGLSFWDLKTGKEKAVLPALKGFNGWLAVAPDRRRIVSEDGSQTQIHDPVSGRVIEPKGYCKIPAGNLLFFPDGQRLLIYGRPGGYWEKHKRPKKICDERKLLIWDCKTERLSTIAFPRGMRELPPGVRDIE